MSDSKVCAPLLDQLVETVEKGRGIRLDEVEIGKALIVETLNTVYTIHILNPQQGDVTVSGGKFFPEPIFCKLSGSTLGSMLITLYVAFGFCLEFRQTSGEVITTTPVQSISFSSPNRLAN